MTASKKYKNSIKKVVILAIWLMIWQLLHVLVSSDLLLPSPIGVAARIFYLLPEPVFWLSVSNTLARIFIGFVAAIVAGVVLASMTSASTMLRDFFSPALSVVKSTPVASITILALIWIKSAQLSTFIAFMMTLPIIYENVYQGILSIDRKLTEMADVFRVGVVRKVLGIHLHSVKPFLNSAASAGLGFAWKSGVAAEVIGLPNNTIGIRLYESKIHLETADLFAWTIVIILISAVMEKIFIRIIRGM